MPNQIDHPSHYANPNYKKECITAMQEVFGDERTASFCLLNAFKYLWRRDHKGNYEQDTEKAQWYINKYNSLSGKSITIDNLLLCVELYSVSAIEASKEEVIKDEKIVQCLSKHNVLACTYCPEKDPCTLCK